MLRPIIAKSMLHYHDTEFSTNWDANIYRGCGHRCAYCFAQYSHKYLEADFFDDIFVKTNAAEVLTREFSKRSWRRAPVCIAGVSDAYQPFERDCSIMPGVLKAFIQAKNPLAFATKSTLPLRDLDLFAQLAKVTRVDIAVSISVINEDDRRLIEPFAAPAKERLEMLRVFKSIGCTTGVLFMPILPYIGDTDENLESVFSLSAEANIDHMNVYPLHLRGKTKAPFLNFIAQNYPSLLPKYSELYKGGYVNQEYANDLKKRVYQFKRKYGLMSSYHQIKREDDAIQLSLF